MLSTASTGDLVGIGIGAGSNAVPIAVLQAMRQIKRWPNGAMSRWNGQFLEISMPIYLYKDESGHQREEFVHHADDKGCKTVLCRTCGSTMAPIVAFGQGLCYFEEGRERRIWNLESADERDAQGNKVQAKPVYVRSHEEHKRLMKQRGVDFANRGVGYKGQWI